ncbi:MAG: hypothetical protein ACREHF_13665 [Rhizomicrobium sp.]
MQWDVIEIGQYAGRRYTVPQLLFHDPGHLVRGLGIGMFDGPLEDQGKFVLERAKRIGIRDNADGRYEAEYRLGDFSDFQELAIVQADESSEAHRCVRLPFMDLLFAYRPAPYDRASSDRLIGCFNKIRFGRSFGNPMRPVLHRFFESDENFTGSHQRPKRLSFSNQDHV